MGEGGGSFITVQVPEAANAGIEAYCAQRSKIKRQVISRILENFLRAEDVVKTVLEGEVDQGMELDYARALESMADKLRQKATGKARVIPAIVVDEGDDATRPELPSSEQEPHSNAK